MDEKNCLMLRLLLNRFHGGEIQKLLKAYSEEDGQKVLDIKIDSKEPRALINFPLEALQYVHYSWFTPALQELETEKVTLILSLLPKPHASKLRKALNVHSETMRLPDSIKPFLMRYLRGIFEFNDTLPLTFLPHTALTPLANLTKEELVEVIDFLGLYDLAEEIHHIVDKNLLEKVYSCIPRKKHIFLRKCLHQKEKLVTQRLQLEYWDGDSKKLTKILHHRGMVRLGYALSGQHPDLFWHISHRLDTGRGKKLSSYYQKEPLPGVTEALSKQVSNLLTFIKKESKK